MDQFEYVMVLVSIIVGLGIAHILLGIGGIIDRLTGEREPLALSLVHAAWLVGLFGWLISFWWWEYRFAERVTDWTVGLYFFLVLYAVTLFILAVVLVPRTWDYVKSLDEYFLQRRTWCYWLWVFANVLDLLDSYLKGGINYIVNEAGILIHGQILIAVPIAIIGMRTRNMVFHSIVGVMFMLWQYLSAFGLLPTLAMQ
jgi:hypothetical protein